MPNRLLLIHCADNAPSLTDSLIRIFSAQNEYTEIRLFVKPSSAHYGILKQCVYNCGILPIKVIEGDDCSYKDVYESIENAHSCIYIPPSSAERPQDTLTSAQVCVRETHLFPLKWFLKQHLMIHH